MELRLTATGCHLPHMQVSPATRHKWTVINDIIWQIGLIINLTAYASEMSYVYKMLFGMVDLKLNQYFTLSSRSPQCNSQLRVQIAHKLCKGLVLWLLHIHELETRLKQVAGRLNRLEALSGRSEQWRSLCLECTIANNSAPQAVYCYNSVITALTRITYNDHSKSIKLIWNGVNDVRWKAESSTKTTIQYWHFPNDRHQSSTNTRFIRYLHHLRFPDLLPWHRWGWRSSTKYCYVLDLSDLLLCHRKYSSRSFCINHTTTVQQFRNQNKTYHKHGQFSSNNHFSYSNRQSYHTATCGVRTMRNLWWPEKQEEEEEDFCWYSVHFWRFVVP